MHKKQSIHRRLTGWVLAGVGLLLLISGLVLAAFVTTQLSAQYDRALLGQAQALASLTEQETGGLDFELHDGAMPAYEGGPNAEYFQLRLATGITLARSKSLADAQLPRLVVVDKTPQYADMTLPDGRAGRSVHLRFLPAIEKPDEDEPELLEALENLRAQPVDLVVARERKDLDQLIATLRFTLIATGIIVMMLVIGLVRFAVNTGLRPLEDVRTQAAKLDASSLGARIVPREQTVELDPMIEQFNALLARHEAAFEHERRFSADVAHELRTPLAELRNLAEVGGRWPEDQALVESFFKDVCDATAQMEHVVVNLMALARSERGQDTIDSGAFDIVTTIRSTWHQATREVGPSGRELTFRFTGPAHQRVLGGRDQWNLILTNLFNNAASYSQPGSAITVSLKASTGALLLSVKNRVQSMSQTDLPRLFDRMWRKDQARSDGHHAGLGLTLVAAYAEQPSLEIATELTKDGWFTLSLSGPLAVGPLNSKAASDAPIAYPDSPFTTVQQQ